MKALVVYGSKRGGTEGLAQMVGRALTEQGIDATVESAAGRAVDVGTYDVVVVGGALYANRWHKDARRFVRREAVANVPTKGAGRSAAARSVTTHRLPARWSRCPTSAVRWTVSGRSLTPRSEAG